MPSVAKAESHVNNAEWFFGLRNMSPVRRSAANPSGGQSNPPPEEGPPLDGHVRIPIVRDESDFHKLIDGPHRDASALAWFNERRAVDIRELARTRQAKAEQSKARASAAKSQAENKSSPAKPTIITPGCAKVPDYVHGAPFVAPEHYIKTGVHKEYITPRLLSDGDVVEYDVFKEDLDFLVAQGFDVYDVKNQSYEENFMRLINTWEIATGFATTPIPLEQAVMAARAIPSIVSFSQALMNSTYHYWLKRRKDLGRPLLRRFWGGASTTYKSPAFTVFQTNLTSRSSARRPKRTQHEQRTRLLNLREDLLRIQSLIQKVIQRDRYKLLIGELNVCIFDQMRQELVDDTYISPYWQHLKRTQFKNLLTPDAAPTSAPVATTGSSPKARPSPNLPCRVLLVGASTRPKIPLIRADPSTNHGTRVSQQINPRAGLTLILYDANDLKFDEYRRSATTCRRNAQQLLNIFENQNDLGSKIRSALTGSTTGPAAGASMTGSKASRRYLDT